MRALLMAVALALCGVLASAQRNFTVYHYAPGTNCEGEPFLVQEWSKDPADRNCSTVLAGGTALDNTPRAYKAYCERQTLALADSVNVLQLQFYYNFPRCGFGTQEDETPRAITVRVSGSLCFKEGTLFPKSAVKVTHDCQDGESSARVAAASLSTLFVIALATVFGLMS